MPKKLLRLVLVAFLSVPVVAVGQTRTAPELQHARTALASYDLEGDGTLSVLRELGRFVADERAPEDQRREARFLRAVASTDLLIVAFFVEDPDLAGRVAGALAVEPSALVPFLESELAGLRTGPYREPSAEAAASLRVVRGDPVDFASFRGNRRDALFVRSAARALRSAPDSFPVLASMGRDPCAGQATCSAPSAPFAPDVRAALAVSTDLRDSVRRLERAIASGDPVSPYVSDDVLTVKQALGAVVGHPVVAVPAELGMASMAAGASVPDVDVLILVGPTSIRHAFVPMILSDDARGPHVDALGTPALPALAETPVPASLPSDLVALPDLVSALRPLVGGSRRVAVAAEASAPSQLVVRAWRSVEEAGGVVVGLAGRGPDGTLRTVATRAPTSEDAAVRVFVRMGAYDVDIARMHTSLSRVRGDHGYHFDVAGLERVLRQRTFPTASVRFAGGVAFEALADAVSRLSSESPVEVFLPR
ncbi:MAG: hypothetical protein U0230_07390 [Polyangiales bacterium]